MKQPRTKDKKKIREKWAKALESGKYKQVKHYLTKLDNNGKVLGHCCLGVACELYIKDGGHLKVSDGDEERYYDGNTAFLPEKVAEWLGIDRDGEYNRSSLSKRNDGGANFNTIANIIRTQPSLQRNE